MSYSFKEIRRYTSDCTWELVYYVYENNNFLCEFDSLYIALIEISKLINDSNDSN